MDKLMDQPWFIKVIALLLALLLYGTAVPDDNERTSNLSIPGDENTETIQDIPVRYTYDTESLVVSGVPNSVDVTVQGPMPQVQSAKALKNFEVYVDLEDIKIGSHTVPIKIKDISDKLEVQIDPAYANITVQEKVTKVFEVEAEYDASMLEEGYEAEKPVVEPSKVKITGARTVIEQITYVKATLDIKEKFNTTISGEAKIRVLDQELNKKEVLVEPETVQVTIPVLSTNKSVPIKIVQKGSLPDGILLEDIELETEEATIIGSEEVLKAVESVRVEVNLSEVQNDVILDVPVIIGEGITRVSPQLVKVRINVSKMEERTLSNLSITSEGLSNIHEIEFLTPKDAAVDLTVLGTKETLDKLSVSDFKVFIDVSNVIEGEHEVLLRVDGPDGVEWKLNTSTARISISKKDV